MPPNAAKPTSAKGRQAGDYEPPILTEPRGGPIPSGGTRSWSELRRFNPNQPRDPDGQWSDGIPGLSRLLSLAGGRATIDHHHGDPRLTIGNRSVHFSAAEREQFRRLVINARYGDERGRDSDGAYRLTRGSETLVSLRHVPGTYITDDGEVVDSPDVEGHEVYLAEFDMVLNESGEFGNEPSTRVTLDDLENLSDAVNAKPTARRVDTGNGHVDVFTPGPGRIGLRVPTDDGDANVEFDKKDWKAVWKAINEAIDRRGPRTVQTANGPIEIQFDNPDDLAMGPRAMLFISGPGWSIAAQGQGLKDLHRALQDNARAAEIVRSASDDNQLKHYWLHGEGAGKWSTWTELKNHLVKHVGLERAKRIAAEWFHERYGFWPGADVNRVKHGKPPRGKVVGPG